MLDEARAVRYQGRIDDQYGVGFVRKTPRHNELKDAVDELLAGRSVAVARTQPVGCLIGRAHEPQPNAEVTYANQIARLFNKRCVECHHAGDIAPFSLTRYERRGRLGRNDRRGRRSGPDAAVARRSEVRPFFRRPPAVGRGEAADPRLGGSRAPQGDLKELPPTPTFAASGWHQDRPPDLILPMSDKPYQVKADGELRYQFFRVDPHFTEDKWIEAAEILPGNRAVVHHVLVHARAAGATAECGGAGQGFLAAYVPGLRSVPYPKGMAKRISAGSKLNFQIHYTPNGSKQDDITRIGLWFADPKKVTHEVRTIAAVNPLFAIPAGADNHPVEASTQRLPSDAQILAFMPHMHLRGKSFLYEAVYAERETPNSAGRAEVRLQLANGLSGRASRSNSPRERKIHAVAHFDNSTDNLNNPNPKRDRLLGRPDVRRNDDRLFRHGDATREPLVRRQAGPGRGGFGGFGRLDDESLKDLVKQLDVNKDGKITRDEVPERLQGQFDLISGGKDSVSVEQLQKMLSRFRRRGAD